MIIGNGLVAKAFIKYEHDNDVLIFASGVSNSSEQKNENFNREFNLLKDKVHEKKLLIYFSTCSLFDDSLKSTPYILHKKRIEEFIEKNFKKFIIFRLPTLIGETENPHTFFNFFINKIISGEKIDIHKYAHRYLIDIDDISLILPKFIENKIYFSKKINIAFSNPSSVLKITKLFEDSLNKEAKISLIEKGEKFNIENNLFLKKIKEINYKYNNDYNKILINKYCKSYLDKRSIFSL